MSSATTAPPEQPRAVEREFTVEAKTQWQLVRRRFLGHRPAMLGLVVVILLVLAAYVLPHIYAYDPLKTDVNALSKAPTSHHIFGTDTLGNDLLAQMLAGLQTSLQVGLLATVVSEAFGVLVGAVAGFYRGWVDSVLMRITDVVLTLPIIVLVAVLSEVVGNNWVTMALIIAAVGWTVTARIVRSVILSLREREYIEAARSLGGSDVRVMTRHLVPNALSVIIVDATLTFAAAILTEATLSFLGFGIQLPRESLGTLVAIGSSAASTRPWLFYFPGLLLLILILAVNYVGDGLRDALDPTQTLVRQ